MILKFIGDINTLTEGIEVLQDHLGFKYTKNGNNYDLYIHVVNTSDNEIKINRSASKATIYYNKKIHFFRALGLLIEKIKESKNDFEICETPQFETNGAMFDVSQGNAVLSVKSVKMFLRYMAVMGLNMLMLYCEDSLKVENQPYFGYMRSRYSYDDFKECDDYADMFGIEMIPCIQTLAHLHDALKWKVYANISESHDTLLVEEEKTYAFIKDVIASASKPFRTKKIHIGMDEAWNLGRGKYLDKHGLTPVHEIMKKHLDKVINIVRELNLTPMIWSDMYFRALADDGEYYNQNIEIPEGYFKSIPNDISLVYWDYYHTDESFYIDFLQKHKLCGEPIFAGGIWTWLGYGVNWGKTLRTTLPAFKACKKENIKSVFATIWGDNGTECNVLANIIGLSLFAENGYCKDFNLEKFKNRFEFCTGAKYEDFNELRYLDEVISVEEDNLNEKNPSKYLMWQDILTGLFDYNIKGLELNNHYKQLAAKMESAMHRNGEFNRLFEFYYHVANVLAIKSEIGINITNAYLNKNNSALREYSISILPELEQRVRWLRNSHKENWFYLNKVLGWDIIDMRYGSLLIRIDTAINTIDDYLSGKIDHIEELEETRLPFNGEEGLISYANFYGDIVSPSRIAPKA